MGWFNRKKIRDERIVSLQNKIYREIYVFIMVIVIVSAFVKHYYLGMDFEDVVTEFIILLGTSFYYLFRSVQMGIFSDEVEIRDRSSKWSSTKKNLILCIVTGIGLGIFMGANSAIRYGDGGWNTVYTFFLVFIVTLVFYIPVLLIVFVLGHEAAKSQSKKIIEKQLEESNGDEE